MPEDQIRGSDRRRWPRAASRFPIGYHSPRLQLQAQALDVSARGIFVEGAQVDAEGSIARVLLDHYLLSAPAEVQGKVVRVSAAGMGIELIDPLPAKVQAFLTRYASNPDGRRVLMVDPDGSILRLVHEWVDRAGFRFVGQPSAIWLLESVERFGAELLVADCEMPGLANEVHKVRSPILLYSAMEAGDLEAVAQRWNAAGWLQKGGRPSELVARIKKLLVARPLN